MFEWIDPSFFQFFAFNIIFWISMMGLFIFFSFMGVSGISADHTGAKVIGGASLLIVLIAGLAGKIIGIAVNGYSLYLLFNQGREMDFWFWVLAALYALATLFWLVGSKSKN